MITLEKIKGYWIINPKQGDNREEEYFYPADEVANLARLVLPHLHNQRFSVGYSGANRLGALIAKLEDIAKC